MVNEMGALTRAYEKERESIKRTKKSEPSGRHWQTYQSNQYKLKCVTAKRDVDRYRLCENVN